METFLAFVVSPKKKKPKTKVEGNIMMIPEICWLVFSAINERIVINEPPTKKEINNWSNKITVINLYSMLLWNKQRLKAFTTPKNLGFKKVNVQFNFDTL